MKLSALLLDTQKSVTHIIGAASAEGTRQLGLTQFNENIFHD